MTNQLRRTRVLVVDDHPAIRRGLRHLLAACVDMDVVGDAGDAAGALKAAACLLPDVVLLDVQMSEVDGFEVAGQMRELIPKASIIMLTGAFEAGLHRRTIASGAQSCLLKRDVGECLAEEIRAVVRNEPWVSQRLQGIQANSVHWD